MRTSQQEKTKKPGAQKGGKFGRKGRGLWKEAIKRPLTVKAVAKRKKDRTLRRKKSSRRQGASTRAMGGEGQERKKLITVPNQS